MTAEMWWALIATVSWTSAAVLALHMWRTIHEVRDTPPPAHLCQWVSCRHNANHQVQIRHPAGDVRLWVCDAHLRLACRAQTAMDEQQPYDQELDELENFANGEKP